ncbi:VOC family protein [Marasmitruncus massiliensis]|uniref:VOC family protein n=1 Tax=Marasmitruncus massiliensis TaxID=1944642 RepID=UPI000C7A4B4F|nr:VOC family protein [Marasmitruncus massiliensis]
MNAAQHHHTALYVQDLEWYLSFFRDVFGMSVTLSEGDPQRPDQVWLDGDLQLIRSKDSECTLAHLALKPENAEQAISMAQSLGIGSLARGENWLRLSDGLVLEIM